MKSNYLKYVPVDDIYLFNTGNARKAWLCFGCRYIPRIHAHRFIVWAPNAKSVSLVGDFNGWDRHADCLEPFEGGVWVGFIKGLEEGSHYKYCIEGADGRQVLKADPFAAYAQFSGEDGASIVWNGGDFKWTDRAYIKKREKRNFMSSPMSILELHAGSWKELDGEVNYRNLADALTDYCLDMGYTNVELLPLTEYPFEGSWGYQVTGYYAPTSRYGTPDDFKYFVNKLHSAGIGLILDWVPAHFPKDEHGLANFDGTPQFECKEKRMAEHPEWGTLVFDYESDQVQSFLVSSACKFFEEYHIDGIRVDAVSSMLYLNYARKEGEYTPNREGGCINLGAVDFLRKLNHTVLVNYPGVVTIAEEATAYPGITAPPENGGLGFCMKWDMGFMHDTIDYMKLDPVYRSHEHNKLTFSMMYAFNENYVLPYSHDEVVHGKVSMIGKMSGLYGQKFDSLRALYGYQFAHPGKKLNFMGNEFAQFIEWNYKQQLDWLLLDYPAHKGMQDYYRAINKFYTSHSSMYSVDCSWDGFKWLNVNDAQRSTIAFMRMDSKNNNYVVCVSNFTPVRYDDFVIGLPEKGKLKEVLNSDDAIFGGSGLKNEGVIEADSQAFWELPYSARVLVPPMSTVYYEFVPEKTK